MEQQEQIECPHCGEEAWQYFEFDEGELDREGSPEKTFVLECFDCVKIFYVKANLRFELEINDISQKKPKLAKRKK